MRGETREARACGPMLATHAKCVGPGAARLRFAAQSPPLPFLRMDLTALSASALQLHRAFGARARRQGGRAWSREEIVQGFVVDVGELMQLTMAKRGLRKMDDVDRKLGHELADCLWSVLVLAKLHGVDLEKEFLGMIAETMAKVKTPNSKPRKTTKHTKDTKG